MNWKEVYKLPLHCMEGCPVWISSSNGVHALDTINVDEATRERIVDVLNGLDHQLRVGEPFIAKNGEILYKEKVVVRVRGWGHLTGSGALHLPVEEAAKIQDEFADYIVNTLNHSSNV